MPNISHKTLAHPRQQFHTHSFLQCRLNQHALSLCIEYDQSLLQAGKKFSVAINQVPTCLSSVRTRDFSLSEGVQNTEYSITTKKSKKLTPGFISISD